MHVILAVNFFKLLGGILRSVYFNAHSKNEVGVFGEDIIYRCEKRSALAGNCTQSCRHSELIWVNVAQKVKVVTSSLF